MNSKCNQQVTEGEISKPNKQNAQLQLLIENANENNKFDSFKHDENM